MTQQQITEMGVHSVARFLQARFGDGYITPLIFHGQELRLKTIVSSKDDWSSIQSHPVRNSLVMYLG